MIVLVCGPPCAGKNTYIEQWAQPGDLIVDHDVLAQAAGSPATHDHAQVYRDAAEAEYARLLKEIEAGQHPNAWVIRCLPNGDDRAAWAKRLGAEVVLLCPPAAVLRARSKERPTHRATNLAIHRWLRDYTD